MDAVTQETAEPQRVVVTRTIPRPLEEVWDCLMQPRGAEALLGEGGTLGSKGEDWRATDGTYGVTRSFHPKEQIRFSWHAHDDAPRTMVDMRLRAADGHTEVEIIHDNLPQDADFDQLTRRWEEAIARVAQAG